MTGPSPLSLLKSITKVDIKKHRATIPQRTLPKRNPQLINFCLNINLPFLKRYVISAHLTTSLLHRYPIKNGLAAKCKGAFRKRESV